jgi:phosphate transport system substrate-binding protein
VKNDRNGIGFGGVAYFLNQPELTIVGIKPDQSSPAVLPVAADGKHLNFEVVHSGKYPIARYLYCYTANKPQNQLLAYIEWIRGKEGQQIADELGYVPLPDSGTPTAQKP